MGSSDRSRRLLLAVCLSLALLAGLLTEILIAQGGVGGVPKRTAGRDSAPLIKPANLTPP